MTIGRTRRGVKYSYVRHPEMEMARTKENGRNRSLSSRMQ